MAANSTPSRSSYKVKIQAKYVNGNKSEDIDENKIKYLVKECDYESSYMPVIYLGLSVSSELYNKLIKNEKTAKILLIVKKYNSLAENSIEKNSIKGQFSYVISKYTPNFRSAISGVGSKTDQEYHETIVLALISMDILNKSRKTYQGVYGNSDASTLVVKALNGLKCLTKNFKYNPTYETLIVPPFDSITKTLSFLFNKGPFYDTRYIFFIDFENAYLTDMTGEKVSGDETVITFKVKEVTNEAAFFDGNEKMKKSNTIYVNPVNFSPRENKTINKLTNELVYIDDGGEVSQTSVNTGSGTDNSTTKRTFVRGENPVIQKNTIESNNMIVEIYKDNIESDIFTPTKQYYMENYSDYSRYNGKYTMSYKKEIITNDHGNFKISTMIGLRRIGNISANGTAAAGASEYNNTSVIGKKNNKSNSSAMGMSLDNTKTVNGITMSGPNYLKYYRDKINSGKYPTLSSYIPPVKHIKAKSDNDTTIHLKPKELE